MIWKELLDHRPKAKPLSQESWLEDPTGQWTIRFHRDPRSWTEYPWFFIDRGQPSAGENPVMQPRKHFSHVDALRFWKELRKEGWEKVPPRS